MVNNFLMHLSCDMTNNFTASMIGMQNVLQLMPFSVCNSSSENVLCKISVILHIHTLS